MNKRQDKEYVKKIAPNVFARKLRKNQTPAEQKLWSELRNRRFTNFKFRRQEVIGPYIADFVCISKKIILEADGAHHDIDNDRNRDNYLRSQGYRVLRFSNFDIQRNLPVVLENIWIALHDENFDPNVTPPSPAPSGHPLPTGRGVSRDELKQKRKNAAMQNPDAAQKLLEQFKAIAFKPGAVVAGYAAMGDEISPAPILEFLAAQNFPLCLPVVTGDNAPLEFHAWHPGHATAKGKFNIHEPVRREWVAPEILLVPLLGFDRRGNRMGYGKGFYDRTLAALRQQNKNIIAVGLAFAEQEVAEIAAQPHDQPLNIIVTPKETIYCPAL